MHVSIKMNTPCEFINLQPVNPLISKVQIKVCYVGDEPNRNGTVITRDVAKSMANSLPGSPIVGFYNETKGDFEEHNRIIDLSNGKFEFKDTTRPYGFVDLNARAWFQKFEDDGVEHEYLMTEGYLWTGQYPETKRVLAKGNAQSMEIENVDGTWANNDKGDYEFFIINEAIISKLCILGDDVEPCFEGASISKFEFSFDEKFTNTYSAFIKQMYELINEGGTPVDKEQEVIVEEEVLDEEVIPAEEVPAEEPAEEEVIEEVVEEEVPAEEPVEEELPAEEVVEEEEAPEVEEEPVPEFRVQDTQEYQDLMARCSALETEVEELRAYKLKAERKDKKAMIDSFYMLSDEDKKEVLENIDTYSLDEIEAKLSVICVRNKVSFNLDEENKDETVPAVFSLDTDEMSGDDSVTPAWIKAVQNVAKNKKMK